MRNLLFVIVCLFVIACNGGSAPTASQGSGDFSAYRIADYGGGVEYASQRDGNNDLVEEGLIVNGKREGTWATYHVGRNQGIVKTTTSYINGVKEGPCFGYDTSGRLSSKETYINGQLQGIKAKFQFGKATEEAYYLNGQLHGSFITYHKNGKIQQETSYKKGKQDGRFVRYNEEGALIMDYMYKNGEKVSGGLVDPPVMPESAKGK